jgi:hypothetical protein
MQAREEEQPPEEPLRESSTAPRSGGRCLQLPVARSGHVRLVVLHGEAGASEELGPAVRSYDVLGLEEP